MQNEALQDVCRRWMFVEERRFSAASNAFTFCHSEREARGICSSPPRRDSRNLIDPKAKPGAKAPGY